MNTSSKSTAYKAQILPSCNSLRRNKWIHSKGKVVLTQQSALHISNELKKFSMLALIQDIQLKREPRSSGRNRMNNISCFLFLLHQDWTSLCSTCVRNRTEFPCVAKPTAMHAHSSVFMNTSVGSFFGYRVQELLLLNKHLPVGQGKTKSAKLPKGITRKATSNK